VQFSFVKEIDEAHTVRYFVPNLPLDINLNHFSDILISRLFKSKRMKNPMFDLAAPHGK
jgi:hypothetical protein